MKLNQKLKLVLIIAIIILLSMIGFIGIYVQNKNSIENILPEYLLGMELKGYRKIVLNVSSETETDVETNDESSEQQLINDESIKTEENYKKVKEIIEKRLNKMNLEEYYVRQDLTTGNIIVQIPEDEKTDNIVAQLQLQGKFEIVDNK